MRRAYTSLSLDCWSGHRRAAYAIKQYSHEASEVISLSLGFIDPRRVGKISIVFRPSSCCSSEILSLSSSFMSTYDTANTLLTIFSETGSYPSDRHTPLAGIVVGVVHGAAGFTRRCGQVTGAWAWIRSLRVNHGCGRSHSPGGHSSRSLDRRSCRPSYAHRWNPSQW